MTAPLARFTGRIGALGFAAWLIAGPALAQAPQRKLDLLKAPRTVEAINFADGEGRMLSLADFRGKVVLLNIWATWCIPCRKEMPALDRLQANLGGPNFAVVPLSIDRGGHDVVAKFYAENGIRNLAIYIDTPHQAPPSVGVVGLPTTLIINRGGYEISRIIGPAEWDAPELADVLQNAIARPDDTAGELPPEPPARVGQGSLRRAWRWLTALFTN